MVRDAEGKPLSMFGTHTDITEIKRTQELLLQSERHRAVADLAGGVAHNFNNLLQIIMGGLELALLDLDLRNCSDVRDVLRKILESCKFGAETVRRLQSFAHIRDHSRLLKQKVFDLTEIVEQSLEMSKTWWKTIPERQGIDIAIHKKLHKGCLIRGEKNEMFEVIVNLIKNAAEALPNGGDIIVRTYLDGDHVVLKVRDTGVGISEDHLARLFNPFFTTKAEAGSGLGLSSSRKIIEASGGNILVESVLGKGSTFTIQAPLAELPDDQTDPPAQQPPGAHMTVLVIDDMEDTLNLLKAILSRFGHTVVTATSGSAGVEVFKENPIDVVICDLGMPGINGWEVGKRIKAICGERGASKTPFALLTGWGGQKNETALISESGVNFVLEKPIDIKNLREVLRSVSLHNLQIQRGD